ncbi:hypothetical protein LCGC14_0518690 [marine sediment metagenome]|uniref:MYND finger n=1 Tax=marine sediment metagenome TaxID=412755 RepID=A0A0F9V7A1_9ZZZZ
MGLIKLIILIALLFLAFASWRKLKTWQAAKRPPAASPGSPLLMVRCARCNVHLPQRMAIRDESNWYCCQEHLDENSDS